MNAPADRAGRTGAVALAITLAIQMFTAIAGTATAVLAPEIARDLALSPKLVGVFVGLLYVGGASASLASGGFIVRYGAIRVSQVCVLLCAAGILLLPLPVGGHAGAAGVLALAAVVIGIGYGPITAASSHVLVRTAPPSRMALTFSIKQTGVPAGAALAGAALPGIALAVGWRATFVAVAVLGVAIAVVAQATRATLDADRRPDERLSVAGIFAPLKVVVGHRPLVVLSITGCVYAATQTCLMSFLVVYLTEALHFSLVAAGLALTVANLGGMVGRIGWGAVADHFVPPRTLLGLIGVAAGACAYATTTFGAGWPTAALLAMCGFFGATAIGWNGVQLSQVARHAPPGQAGAITGASGFLTFMGVVLGPPLFAVLAGATGSYRAGFAVFGTLSALCGAWLLVTRDG
jgi:predicted MFS family arabinose efflux permease